LLAVIWFPLLVIINYRCLHFTVALVTIKVTVHKKLFWVTTVFVTVNERNIIFSQSTALSYNTGLRMLHCLLQYSADLRATKAPEDQSNHEFCFSLRFRFGGL